MKRYCRNCFHPLPGKAKYCPQCGQRDSDGKIRMSAMLRKLWDSTIHLEGKFLRTCWQLFIPGKVTQEFFKGKLERYPHPLRMFAIVMFIFLFVVNQTVNLPSTQQNKGDWVEVGDTSVGPDGNQIVVENDLPSYERWKHQAMLYDFQHDYEKLPEAWRTPASRKAVDSLLRQFNLRHGFNNPGLPDTLSNDSDTTSFGFFGKYQIRLATFDIVRYEPDEIIRRYNFKDWWMQLFVRQTIKSYKNPDALMHAFIGSLTWTILALIALMSGILALLNWRRQHYYVEHFIFLLHYHTGLMLAILLVLIGIRMGLLGVSTYYLVFIWATYAMYRAMRRYYGQTRGKTILKWMLFGVSYYFSFLLLFILGLFVVFAIF